MSPERSATLPIGDLAKTSPPTEKLEAGGGPVGEDTSSLEKERDIDTGTKYVFLQSTTVYVPSSELGLSHTLSHQRVCPSPGTKGGGAHSPAGEGLGES